MTLAAESGRHDRRSRFSKVALGILLSGCVTFAGDARAAGPGAAEIAFDRHEIVTGSAGGQTVLTGFLLGGAVADLAVLHVDENDDRRLRIYAFDDGTWAPALDTTLRPDVLFVDVANLGGRDRLITYADSRLSWFDPESATLRPLVEVACSFNPPRGGEIPHVDVTRDVNGDDRDDLVVPDIDGFWVAIQAGDGALAEPVKIGPATDLAGIYGADGYRYDPWSQSRIHEIDYNGDGRGDLVFWNEDHFELHLQDEHGRFSPVAKSFTTDVAFDSDDSFSLASGDMTGKVLHSLADLNGDGVGDLVTYSLEGIRISQKRSAYEVHFGKRAPDGGTSFVPEAGATFPSDDSIQLGMKSHDFDGDGQIDLMLTSIHVRFLESSLWKRIKGAMGDDIWLELEFYETKNGLFPDEPNATRVIALDGAPSHREPGWVPLEIVLRGPTHQSRKTQEIWPRAFNRTLLIGDVTGDRRSDLVIESEFHTLEIFVGVPGPGLFARLPQKVAVALHDEEYTWLTDLNGDGKQDIVMHHPFTLRNAHGAPTQPPGTEPHRVEMLIAR